MPEKEVWKDKPTKSLTDPYGRIRRAKAQICSAIPEIKKHIEPVPEGLGFQYVGDITYCIVFGKVLLSSNKTPTFTDSSGV